MSPEQPQLDPARDGRYLGGPAWRVNLAEQVVATGRRLHEGLDPVVRDRVAFARLVRGGPQGLGQAVERFPAIAADDEIQRAEGMAAKLKTLVIGGCEPPGHRQSPRTGRSGH